VAVIDETIKCHRSQHTSAAALVPQQKEGATSSPLFSGFPASNEKEAKVSDSSLMKSEGHVDDRPLGDIGESSPLSNTISPQTVLVKQPLSFVENPVAPRCELQSLADKPVIHDEAIVVEDNLVIHASSVKGKVNPEASSHEDKETAFGVSGNFIDTEISFVLYSGKFLFLFVVGLWSITASFFPFCFRGASHLINISTLHLTSINVEIVLSKPPNAPFIRGAIHGKEGTCCQNLPYLLKKHLVVIKSRQH